MIAFNFNLLLVPSAHTYSFVRIPNNEGDGMKPDTTVARKKRAVV